MNLLESSAHPILQNVGWALLHSLWQGTIVGVAFKLFRLVARKASPEIRYLAGCSCLALLVAGPVLTCGRSTSATRDSFGIFSVLHTGSAALTSTGRNVYQDTSLNGPALSLIDSSAAFLGRLTPLLTGLWLLGVSVCAFRLTRSYWQVRELGAHEHELVDGEWIERLNDLRLRLGVSRPVRLVKSALVEVPTVVGWLRPVILLPAATLMGLAPEQLEAILAHELAHVRRLDYLVNACQCVIETLMFYHPVVWWISRCVREERENCCDDLVLDSGGDRVVYAHALALLEEARIAPADLAVAASGGALLQRIRRLLGANDETHRPGARQVCGLTLLGVGLVLFAAGVYLNLGPKTFRSLARIRLEPALETEVEARPGKSGRQDYDPYFMQTEFEVIQSEAVLGKVIEDLNLNKEWGRKYANGETLKTQESMQLLKNKMDLRPVRNTSLIEIVASSEDRNEPAQIVNGIAESYQQYTAAERQRLSRGGIAQLLKQQAEQAAKIREAEAAVIKLREELQFPDQGAEGNAPDSVLSAEALRRIEGLRIETESQVIGQEAMLKDLKKRRQELGLDRLAQILPTAVQDLLLSGLLEQRALADQKLIAVQREYGPDHIEVRRAVAQVEDLKIKVNDRVDGILTGLEVKTASLKEGLRRLEEELASAKINNHQLAIRSQPYLDAKQNLDALRQFNQMLEQKISTERVEAERPKAGTVAIVTRATPPMSPVSPDRPLGAGLMLLGLLLTGAGLVLLKAKPVRVSLQTA